MKNLILIVFFGLFATVASAQLNNIIKRPLEDTIVPASTYVAVIDSTDGNKIVEKITVANLVKNGAVGNFKTVGDSSILGTGNVPFKTVSDSLIVGEGNIEFKTVNGEYIIGSGDINTTSNLEDSLQEVTTAANDSLVVLDGANVVHFNIAGTPGTQTTLALVLPGTAHLSNELDVYFSDNVTTLAITSTGGTTVYSPTAIVAAAAGDVLTFKRIGTVWFRKP